MNDPWDVKCVRQSDQYISCMKINGVPLLPPVLSQECRKEMQYYKILAREVAKRIALLKPYTDTDDSDSTVTRDDSPALSENEKSDSKSSELDNVEIEKIFVSGIHRSAEKIGEKPQDPLPKPDTEPCAVGYESLQSNVTVIDNNNEENLGNSPNQLVDACAKEDEKEKLQLPSDIDVELPERDYNSPLNKTDTQFSVCFANLPVDTSTEAMILIKKELKSIGVVTDAPKKMLQEERPVVVTEHILIQHAPPAQSSCKSFTGSLNDIHKEFLTSPKLVRQSSYTLLNPSPQLLAHLEVQSLNSGVEMSCISMSESCSNISWQNKKRRSWDLESAKVKWSSMATELNQRRNDKLIKPKTVLAKSTVRQPLPTPIVHPGQVQERGRQNGVLTDRSVSGKRNEQLLSCNIVSPNQKNMNTSRRISSGQSPTKQSTSKAPIVASNSKLSREPTCSSRQEPPKRQVTQTIKKSPSPSPPASPTKSTMASVVGEDPSVCIRELYDKIQRQQMLQMAGLIEKQKKEQLLLQQVFEEQNSLLSRQLKSICPKSPIEVRKAWVDKTTRDPVTPADQRPVSLSQLINNQPAASNGNRADTEALVSALHNTTHNINRSEEVLKKSKNVLNGIKKNQKPQMKTKTVTSPDHSTSNKTPSTPVASARSTSSNIPRARDDRGSRYNADPLNRQSPHSSTPKKLQSGHASARDVEDLFSPRTNDTLDDLNFTFPIDDSDYFPGAYEGENMTHSPKPRGHQVAPSLSPTYSPRRRHTRSASVDSNIDDKTLKGYQFVGARAPMNGPTGKSVRKLFEAPTPKQREAATKIVAYAKGYLIRRLLKTERVQATVQTIRDALVCALQLHQEREGIRGADIDLHRRLIQQITAACYSLHDTFVVSSASERCTMIAQDRERQRLLNVKQLGSIGSFTPRPALNKKLLKRKSDV